VNLAFLAPLYHRPGPWASVYLDIEPDRENSISLRDLGWRALNGQLEQAGADAATRDALDTAVFAHNGVGRHGLALFATGGEVVLEEPLPAAPARPDAVWTPLPALLPLVTMLGEQARWLRVVVDRGGGDLTLHSGGVPATVKGSAHYPIRKVSAGGWSQPRYQRAAQTNWDRDAREVAEAVAQTADRTGADVLVLAGDMHARQLVAENLPARVAGQVVQTEAGSRAPGAAPEPLDEATAEAVRVHVADRRASVLDTFRVGRAHGLAAIGREAVLAALARVQVATLLIRPPLTGTVRVSANDPRQLDLDSGGTEIPLADAVLGAAVAGDADLLIVGPDEEPLPDGLGAVLRYSDASTPLGG
jgi:hypothetical protein